MKFSHISDPPQPQLTLPSAPVQPIAAIWANSRNSAGFPYAGATNPSNPSFQFLVWQSGSKINKMTGTVCNICAFRNSEAAHRLEIFYHSLTSYPSHLQVIEVWSGTICKYLWNKFNPCIKHANSFDSHTYNTVKLQQLALPAEPNHTPLSLICCWSYTKAYYESVVLLKCIGLLAPLFPATTDSCSLLPAVNRFMNSFIALLLQKQLLICLLDHAIERSPSSTGSVEWEVSLMKTCVLYCHNNSLILWVWLF